MFFYALIFIGSFFLLFLSSKFLVGSMTKLSKVLGWKEFVVSFFIIAFATTIPNFFIGIMSALNGIPVLSFSDVVGTNIADFSLIVALTALVSKGGLSAPSKTVQGSCIFTFAVALLPLLLIQDGNLSRIDGILLLICLAGYIAWLFQKEDRFKKTYAGRPLRVTKEFFLKNVVLMVVSIVFLLLAAKGIVEATMYFADNLKLPITIIGFLVIGLGTALPEISFTLHAAKESQDWFIFGDIMGSAIMSTTLVLGTVAVIHPIIIPDLQPFAIARAFLVIAAILFFIFTRSDKKVTRKEGFILLLVYIAFVLAEIITH